MSPGRKSLKTHFRVMWLVLLVLISAGARYWLHTQEIMLHLKLHFSGLINHSKSIVRKFHTNDEYETFFFWLGGIFFFSLI